LDKNISSLICYQVIKMPIGFKGFQKGNKLALGKKSEEHKRNISLALKGKLAGRNNPFYGKHHTLESRRKMSEARKGHPSSKGMLGKYHTEQTKRKISIALKGKVSSNKGKHFSEEQKRKMSEAHRGEKSYFWKGGISFEPYSIDWTETLRKAIRERDHYVCQLCQQYGNTVHHIDYDKKNCNPDNLITLCNSCNLRVNNNRNYWKKFFQERSRKI